MKYIIEKAKVDDVPHIYELVNKFAKKNLMLPRVINDIYERLQEFFVARTMKKNVVIGCVSLHITWTGKKDEVLAEIRSLAVGKKYQNKGVGTALIKNLEEEAKRLGVKKIFALTYIPEFFHKLGYETISRELLPHKVWTECINCPYFMNCKEIPVIKMLK
jgi:amino-acid N-acetyltransferase